DSADGRGRVAAVAEAGVTALPRSATVLILGGGATACSALAAARGLGAAQATAAVRDPARARDLLAAAGRLAVGLTLTDFGDPEVTAPDVLISTVPVGAADFHAERITRGTLAPGHLLDVVYHPWPTPGAAAPPPGWHWRGGRFRAAPPPGRRPGPPDDRQTSPAGGHAHRRPIRPRCLTLRFAPSGRLPVGPPPRARLGAGKECLAAAEYLSTPNCC